MGKYQKEAQDLLEFIGGKENIAAVSHCATRMRFVLNDPSKADEDKIDDIPVVKGMFTNAGQFQVIIGNDVPVFFNDFSAVSGISGVSKDAGKEAAKQNLNVIQRIVSVLAEVFAPIIPAIIIGGLILGFRNLMDGVPISAFGGQTIIEHSQFWAGVHGFLWLIGEAIFHFLPVGITWSIAKKMGTTQILGIVLGITLVSPQLLNAYGVASTAAADIPVWDFGFAQVQMIGYQAQVIPAMLAGFMLAYLEIFFRKYVPQSISMIFVPFLSLVPTVLAAHVILGPIGWAIGSQITNVVSMAIDSSFAWLFGIIYGTFYAPLVITGLHHLMLTIDLQMIADLKYTTLWPMVALSNIAQGSAVLAVVYLHRGNKKEEQVSIPSTISAYLGVTEPAMFGINLKYLYPFVAAMIGSGIAGCYITVMNVKAMGVGIGGLPGIISIQAGSQLHFAIGMLIVIVVPFVLTIFFRQRGILNKLDPVGGVVDAPTLTEEPTVNSGTVEIGTESFYAPVNGTCISITEVPDPVFSQKMMGDGFAIKPTDTNVYSPVEGKVTNIFNTKHAIGITSNLGIEVLIHMGLDTVELDGKPFEVKVAEGDSVTMNTLIATMDLEAVTSAGKQTDIIVALTNVDKAPLMTLNKTNTVTHSELIGAADVL
ncbi:MULTISPECIES: PTS system trehalose-specific EIIBC component [Vagococcus]|uniref:PTS system sucrose-specific EIIBCA component n=1 Tax=Vagococcus fluvialis bH819 TaxID=1255619 RepID=A0A1X6WK41_9ENTE|nr:MULTISPECIES: PTS system trehalose-specific EIIBC component [Vagococcus]SLM84674.1 PTS system, trehalose-specific IIB component / PTS system, trehalose-specific IIC component [Vagococcus fluvialis bH819]HCM89862.1 PTS trehalose transporter subunit IIBC [Vagococcus sp.]